MPEHEYYIRSTKAHRGHTIWWCQYAIGYTCDLKQAGLFTKEYVDSLHNKCAVAHHKDTVDPAIIEHCVKLGKLHKSEFKLEGC